MFSAELKSDTLKGLVNIISTLIDEVKFTITSEGMTLKAVVHRDGPVPLPGVLRFGAAAR